MRGNPAEETRRVPGAYAQADFCDQDQQKNGIEILHGGNLFYIQALRNRLAD
jgi:hypothetical protein